MIKLVLFIIGLMIVAFVVLLVYLSITKYRPKTKELLFESIGDTVQVSESKIYQVMTWNTGYAGLDKSMDFFYDGGKQVCPTKNGSVVNFEKIKSVIRQLGDSADFILLQEVDKDSKRSYRLNQMEEISKLFPDRNVQHALNYNVKFVPLPLTKPVGKVESGLLSLSNYTPKESVRHAFPSSFPFPKNLAMLQRCFLANRYPIENGKELLIINTHNSAYDDGSLRKKEMQYFKSFLQEEYQKGNYVLVGGDWNLCPPKFIPNYETKDKFDNVSRIDIDADYLPDWQWAYDATIPTNRRVVTPYIQGETRTTVIDFFLLSPNLEMLDVRGHYLGFEASDHNPVTLKFKIR